MTRSLAIVAYVLTCWSCAVAQTERVIYSFAGAPDGGGPLGGLTADAQGNFYGTTGSGGGPECGTVFEVKRSPGNISESVIWTFGSGNASDGCNPEGGVIVDAAGNLYGTTFNGGIGAGTAFELSPDGSGGWTEKILWNFGGVSGSAQDGKYPQAGLAMDGAGDLYGTTAYGGGSTPANGCGTVFGLSPNGDGSWSEAVIHDFGSCASQSGDGQQPFAGVRLDAAGNVYGTTNIGGASGCGFGCGTVFMLEKASAWKEIQLYLFQGGNDGANPYTPVTFASPGHLLGTTLWGGLYGEGVVFELIRTSAGWQESVLHAFGSPFANPPDGVHPNSGLAAGGNHYFGTTWTTAASGGIAYELTHTTAGWSYRILHSFGAGKDGSFNEYYGQAVLVAPAGRLYGAADAGGAHGLGAVFEITP
jgi:uncharacterized repeat protein (TIGR03803 family)